MRTAVTASGRSVLGTPVVTKADLENALALYVGETEDIGSVVASPRPAVAAQVKAVARPFSSWLGSDCINIKSYAPIGGNAAVGDNTADDLPAISAAIQEANARFLATGGTFPTSIVVPPGVYKISGPLPAILGSTALTSLGGPRSAVFNFVPGASGSAYDHITFKGQSGSSPVSCANAGISGIQIGSYGITGGNQLAFDWATTVHVRNLLSVNAYNFCSLRQVNDITFDDVFAENITGQYGIKAYGEETSRTGSARNGAPDWVSLLNLTNTKLVGNNKPGTAGSADLLLLDGAVQTVNFNTLILLKGGRGIHSMNSPGVPNPLFTSFLWGSNLQIEDSFAEGIKLECANSVQVFGLYVVGSASTCGVFLGGNVDEVAVVAGRVAGNYTHGWDIVGAKQGTIIGVSTWNNSQMGSAQANGFNFRNGAKRFRLIGGLSGARENSPATVGGSTSYTEMQAYGLASDGSTAFITADGMDLLSNVISPATNGVTVGSTCWTS